MRTLIFLFFGLFMLTAIFVVKRLDARREKKLADPSESKALSLKARLEQSAIVYRAAAETLPDDRLKEAISELANRCSALATRGRFSRKVRTTIIRLLLSLNDVVQRVTAIETASDTKDDENSSTDKSIELIGRASEALEKITDRADDAALRRLEADLDVLKDRLAALH